MQRGAVIIIDNTEVILIERVRAGRTYYLFPGGGVEAGETAGQAAVREAREELGLDVSLGRLAAVVEHEGNQQSYFFASILGGEFGSGDGLEMTSRAASPDGSYHPVRLRLSELNKYDVRPRALATALVLDGTLTGHQVLQIKD